MTTRRRKPMGRGLTGLFAILLSSWLWATDDGNSPKYLPSSSGGVLVLKKTVRRVVVDVVVRGMDGRPVRGLTAKDFSLSEDGRPQRVLSFDVYEFDRGSISIPASAPALPANVFVNVPKQPEKGPLFILLLDMANTEDLTDQIIARQQAVKFILNKPEGTRFAVFLHYDGLKLVQGFTADKNILYAALDPKNSKSGLPKAFLMASNFHQGSDPTVATVSAITHLAQFLDGIPGRKNIIWMSAKFPVSIYARAGDPLDRQLDVRREFNELTRAQIAVYPLNVRGVLVNPEGRLTGGGPHTGVGGATPSSPAAAAVAAGAPSGAVAGSSPTAGGNTANQEALNSTYESAYLEDMMSDDIASSTGGRAFYSTNDLAGALDEIVEDGSNYYTLTYSSSNPNYDGTLRNIRVAIEGHKYKLQYRRTYYADDPELQTLASAGKKAGDPNPESDPSDSDDESGFLLANLRHGAPMVHQLIFKARIHPVGAPSPASAEQMAVLSAQPGFRYGKMKRTGNAKPVEVQTYAIYYALVCSQVKAEDGSIPLEFAAAAYDGEGRTLNSLIQKTMEASAPAVPGGGISLSPGEAAKGRAYRAMQELVVPLTATSIRVAVRDTLTDRVGTLEVSLPLAPENDGGSTASTKPTTPPAF